MSNGREIYVYYKAIKNIFPRGFKYSNLLRGPIVLATNDPATYFVYPGL